MVLVILAIVAGLVVPALSGFAAGRRTKNAATLVLGLANYARTQAVAEGTVYRLNFDAGAGTVWLTEQSAGEFRSPTATGYGQRFPLPEGVRMSVDVATPGRRRADRVAERARPRANAAPAFGPTVGTPNPLLQVAHADGGTYVEVQPGGRIDPCHVHLSDDAGNTIDLGAATATDVLHVLKPGEL